LLLHRVPTNRLSLSCFTRYLQATATHRKLEIGTFASVGQDLLGIPSINASEDVLFGTSVALSSLEGTRLVVGAPMHDYNATEADESAVNDNGGGVFLYDYDGSNWNLLWFLAGDPGEGLGERLSLSGDGSRVALRRERDAPDSAEVYDINPDGSYTQMGEAVSCGTNGDTVTLSSDGMRLAVSCENSEGNTGLVEIFEWTGIEWASIGTISGSTSSDFFGWVTAFSTDGQRIAVSAPNHDGADGSLSNRGLVRVYDYGNNLEWTQAGPDILGPNAFDQMGFSMDLSGDGLSLVAASPGGDNGNLDATGLVNVFTESLDGTWTQVGDPIPGVDARDRFGRSLSVSDDGSRLVASSYTHDRSSGHLRLFDLEGGSWVQYGSDIDGENPVDRFGFGRFSVTMTGDGTRFASGSTLFGDGGQVRVFDSSELVVTSAPTLTPTTAPTTEPTTAQSLEPTSGNTPVPTTSQTGEPTTAQTLGPTSGTSTASPTVTVVASFTPTATPTSLAQSLGPTPADTPEPTAIQTLEPSTAQTIEPTSGTNTASPTMTAAPSFAPTVTQTSLLGKTDWDIDRAGNITVQFSESSADQEIEITFDIHRRDALVQVFEEDCKTTVDASIIGLSTTRAPISSTKDALEVILDIKQDAVMQSPIFSEIDAETATISLCIRVDLLQAGDGASSVVFYDQNLLITVDMAADFSVVNIGLVRENDSVNVGVSFEYTMTACQCNEQLECVTDTLTQASDALICVETNATNVEIESIRQLAFTQGLYSQNAVVNGAADDLTIVTLVGKKAVIRTKLFSAFFDQDTPGSIDATGVCTLMFADENGQVRRLRAPVMTSSRDLKETNDDEAADAGFNVEFFLENDLESSGSSKAKMIVPFMLAVMAFGAALLV